MTIEQSLRTLTKISDLSMQCREGLITVDEMHERVAALLERHKQVADRKAVPFTAY